MTPTPRTARGLCGREMVVNSPSAGVFSLPCVKPKGHGRHETHSSQVAEEARFILAIEAQAAPPNALLRYDRLQRALAVVLEDYYHERGHDYEHDAGQLAMLLLAQGLAAPVEVLP